MDDKALEVGVRNGYRGLAADSTEIAMVKQAYVCTFKAAVTQSDSIKFKNT